MPSSKNIKPLDPVLFKSFHIADEITVATFPFGNLFKSTIFLTQNHLCIRYKLKKKNNIMLRYDQLVQIDANHNSLQLRIVYSGLIQQHNLSADVAVGDVSDSSSSDTEDNVAESDNSLERVLKLRSIEEMNSVVILCKRMYNIQTENKDLCVNVEKTKKEKKTDEKAFAVISSGPPPPVPPKPSRPVSIEKIPTSTLPYKIKTKSLDLSNGTTDSSSDSITAGDVLPFSIIVQKGDMEYVERELLFQKESILIRLTLSDAAKKKKPEKDQITIPYENIKAILLQDRSHFITIEYAKRKTIELLVVSYIDFCRKLFKQRGEALTFKFAQHAGIWADRNRIENFKNEKPAKKASFSQQGPINLFVLGPIPAKKEESPIVEPPTNVLKTTITDLNERSSNGKLGMAPKPFKAGNKRPPAKKKLELPKDGSSCDALEV